MERKFGHCVANWIIENSHMLPMNFPFQILSPEFEVRGFMATKWAMKLKNEAINNGFVLYFQLEKLDSDGEDLQFLGECKGKISGKTKNNISFSKDFTWELNPNERSLNIHIHPKHNSDILFLYNLHIECKLLVTFSNVEEDIETCSDVGLRELSQDLLRLYESERESDLILIAHDTNSVHHLNAHKPILQSRNELLGTMLNSNKKKITVDHHLGCVEEWRNILKFLYTADMKHLLNPPKISYYDISKAYNIEPILSFYEPDELYLHSTIPVEPFSTTCIIPEFLTNNEIILEIPQLTNGTEVTRGKLSLHPISFKDKSCTFLIIEVYAQTPETFLVELYAHNAHRKDLFHQVCGKRDGKLFYLFTAVEKEIWNHYLEDGNLTLDLKLQMVNLNLVNGCPRYSSSKIKCKPYSDEENFRSLSRDMMKLYYDSNDKKSGFRIGNEQYFAHKCILAVRAEFIFNKVQQRKVVRNENARHWVMIHLLYFLYTGKYNFPFDLKSVLALYDLADSFDIETLKRILEHNIQLNMHRFRTENLLKVFCFIESQNMPNLSQQARIVLDPSIIKKFIE